MKKQYIRPAHVQVMITNERFIAESLNVNNVAQDGVSGDVKEFVITSGDWDDDDGRTWGKSILSR